VDDLRVELTIRSLDRSEALVALRHALGQRSRELGASYDPIDGIDPPRAGGELEVSELLVGRHVSQIVGRRADARRGAGDQRYLA
jgi:hypothetical protein